MVAATPWLDEASAAAVGPKISHMTVHNGADTAYDPYDDVRVVAPRRGGRGRGAAYALNSASAAAAAWRRTVAPLTSLAAAARWKDPAYKFDASTPAPATW